MEKTTDDLFEMHEKTAKNLVDYVWNHPATKSESLPQRVLTFLVVFVLLPMKTIKDIIQNFRKK